VKILQNNFQGWPRTCDCARCGSTLEVELEDVNYDEWKVSGYHFDGSAVSKWMYTFKCAACGHEASGNELLEANISLEHRKQIKEKSRP
jgi:transcription elongation factor Elf1